MSSKVSTFDKVQVGDYDYLFFISGWSDHVFPLARDMSERLEAFGLQVKESANVVTSYDQVREDTYRQILHKNSPNEVLEAISSTDALFILVIQRDFAEFNPEEDSWGLIILSEQPAGDLERLLKDLALIAHSRDVFGYIQQLSSRNAFVSRAQSSSVLDKDTVLARPIFTSTPDNPQYKCDVFVIMPFDEKFTDVYTEMIQPVGRNLNLAVKRGDDFFSNHHIMDEIWNAILNASLVIADCTGRNANVFYELGIAHTLGKPTILLTQDIKDVPFDVGSRRFIAYQNTASGARRMRDELKEKIRLILDTE